MLLALERERLLKAFSSARVLLNTKPRRNASLSAIVGKSKELESGQATYFGYGTFSAHRYLIAKNITFDLLVTVYNVNSFELFAFRATRNLDAADMAIIKKQVASMKRPNLEMRAIGMQNGNGNLLDAVDKVRKLTGAQIIEVDIFGNEIRNIAIDAKNGTSYDLLLLDRIYRPVELINNAKFEDVMKDSKQLNLV